MSLFSEIDVQAIVDNTQKVIEGDIHWQPHATALPAAEFIAEVNWDGPFQLMLAGWFNSVSHKLSFALIVRGAGRVYGLDIGRSHTNPQGESVGEVHKHRWTAVHGDRWAYVPADITADWSAPIIAWREFCVEANIRHMGTMVAPTS